MTNSPTHLFLELVQYISEQQLGEAALNNSKLYNCIVESLLLVDNFRWQSVPEVRTFDRGERWEPLRTFNDENGENLWQW